MIPSNGFFIFIEKENTHHYSVDKTIYVDDDNIEGPWDGTMKHPYRYIQDAIDVTEENDTVFVYDGRYQENIFVNKSIRILGEDNKKTMIDGMNKGNTITLMDKGITISGFFVSNGSWGEQVNALNWYYAGIRVIGSDNIIEGNIISNNRLGIFGKQVTNLTIRNNRFINDGVTFYPYDIEEQQPPLLKNHFRHTIIDNTVNGEPLLYYVDKNDIVISSGVGQLIAVNCTNLTLKNITVNHADFEVFLVFCSHCLIENSTFAFHDGAFSLLNSDYNIIRYNKMSHSFHGLLLDYGSTNNRIYGNHLTNNRYCGLMIEYFSNDNVITWNNFKENKKYANAFFYKSFRNRWERNYWDDWIGIGPKVIPGMILNSLRWWNFDWHAAGTPHDVAIEKI
jgi:parallel beta-helix repeat protein